MREIVGENFFHMSEPESFGVVNDVRYVRCYWPRLDVPTALFADGSSGIEVQGPPTPRNVIFPPDTVFLPIATDEKGAPIVATKGDCFFERTMQEAIVAEGEKVRKTLEVEPGVLKEVEYLSTKEVLKNIETIKELSAEQVLGKR